MPALIEKLVLTATTSKRDSGGTDANVYLCFNGGRLIYVPAEKRHFQKGSTDRLEWDVARFNLDYEGVARVEIFQDSSGEGPGWFIDALEVQAVVAGQPRPLTRNQDFGWLDRSEKAGDRRDLTLTKG